MDSAELTFTPAAANKIKTLVDQEGDPTLKLRVYVTGGGCSGFNYGFTFEHTTNDDDFSFENCGVSIIVDSMSFQYLAGSVVDYVETLASSQFTIKNPLAVSTCGCGSSFSV